GDQASATLQVRQVTSVAYSPDGRVLTLGFDGRDPRHWDLVEGRWTRPPLTPPVRLAVDVQRTHLSVRDPRRTTPQRLNLPKTRGMRIDALTVSSDGRTVATAGDRSRFWDPAAGRMLPGGFALGYHHTVALAMGPHRNTIAIVTADRTLRFWSLRTRKPVGPPRSVSDAPPLLAYSPVDDTVALAQGRELRFFDAADDRVLGSPRTESSADFTAVAFSPDGRTVTTSDGQTVKIWDAPVITPPA
ncbi:WD40 repeat domain-containing protein, partial [Actinocorallia lasiicapitis]